MGILEKGHLVETDRSGLVAEYAGQTGPKANQKIDEALDGVLFIDEAYSLFVEELFEQRGGRMRSLQRELETVSLQPSMASIYRIVDSACPDRHGDSSCQTAFASFRLLVTDPNPGVS